MRSDWENHKDEWIAKGREQFEPRTILNLGAVLEALGAAPIDGANEGVGVYAAPDKDPGMAADWSRHSRGLNCDSSGACAKLCISERDLQKMPADVARKHKDLGFADWNTVKRAGKTALRCLNNSDELVALYYETLVGMSKADQDKHFRPSGARWATTPSTSWPRTAGSTTRAPEEPAQGEPERRRLWLRLTGLLTHLRKPSPALSRSRPRLANGWRLRQPAADRATTPARLPCPTC